MSTVPMRVCGYAAAIVALAAAGYFFTHVAYNRGYAAATSAIEKQAQVHKDVQQAAANSASKDYQADKAAAEQEAEIRYVEVQKIIDRPVYVNECFDASGVQLVNQVAGKR